MGDKIAVRLADPGPPCTICGRVETPSECSSQVATIRNVPRVAKALRIIGLPQDFTGEEIHLCRNHSALGERELLAEYGAASLYVEDLHDRARLTTWCGDTVVEEAEIGPRYKLWGWLAVRWVSFTFRGKRYGGPWPFESRDFVNVKTKGAA